MGQDSAAAPAGAESGRAGTCAATITALAKDTPSWHDMLRLVDSTPLPCGTSRETVKRSELSGQAGYGYCASHSRFFWGFRLYSISTPEGMPPTGGMRSHASAKLGRIRQWIESVFDTLKGQLTLEQHGARTLQGVKARVGSRFLALAAGIRHHWRIDAPRKRSLTAYDH